MTPRKDVALTTPPRGDLFYSSNLGSIPLRFFYTLQHEFLELYSIKKNSSLTPQYSRGFFLRFVPRNFHFFSLALAKRSFRGV